jgi:ureidoglycolate dehydrogenase (NAD+)
MTRKIYEKELAGFCECALLMFGLSKKDAKNTAKVLSKTDSIGIHSHGTKNLRLYIEKIKLGSLDPKAQPKVVSAGEAFAIIDAGDGMGMVSSTVAMSKAMELAKKCGIGFVSVKNGCHFGAAGYYASIAAERGMIGIAMCNTDMNMAVPGGKGMVIGNNPIAYAVPAGKYGTMSLDISMSTTAALKINQAKLDKKPIPDNWLVDDQGVPTTDPKYYGIGGALQPMAAHKGYGLSLLVDVLCGFLSGGQIPRGIPSWCFVIQEKNRASSAFIALNIAAFQPIDAFIERMEGYIDYIKSLPKAKGADTIYYPGEIELNRKKKADKEGITLPDDVVDSLEKLSQSTGIKIVWMD